MERIIIHFLKKITTRLETSLSEVSFNLDDQPVKTQGRTRTRVSKRTVYRIDIDDETSREGKLVGSVLMKGKWNRVVFDDKAGYWVIDNGE